MTQIKICGLYREEDISYVNEAGPDYCGFIINFPKSHRNLSPQQVSVLRKGVRPGIRAVGVFVDQPMELVASLLQAGTVDIAQLHGHEDHAYIEALRGLCPGCEIWKAFKIRTAQDLALAEASPADRILLDNGYGTGQCFDWSLAGGIKRPFMLAGGLTPQNIAQAVRQLKPLGVDISSGVEIDKKKDKQKMLAAVRAAREE